VRPLLLFAFVVVVVTPAYAETIALAPLDGLGVDPALLTRLDAALTRELRALPDVSIVDARALSVCARSDKSSAPSACSRAASAAPTTSCTSR
jgi:hypothetical protein